MSFHQGTGQSADVRFYSWPNQKVGDDLGDIELYVKGTAGAEWLQSSAGWTADDAEHRSVPGTSSAQCQWNFEDDTLQGWHLVTDPTCEKQAFTSQPVSTRQCGWNEASVSSVAVAVVRQADGDGSFLSSSPHVCALEGQMCACPSGSVVFGRRFGRRFGQNS